jgi:peptidoglycan hydrolase CwlO-like protein
MQMMDHIKRSMAHHLGLFHILKKSGISIPPLITDIGSCIIQTGSESNLRKMRRSTGSHRTISVEEHDELVNTVKNLQINLRDLSNQVLTIMEITIQQREEHQRTRDECKALRKQLANL